MERCFQVLRGKSLPIAFMLGVSLLLGACRVEGGTHNPAPTWPPGVKATPSSLNAFPLESTLPGFACRSWSGKTEGSATLLSATPNLNSSFDRFVLEFEGSTPSYDISLQPYPNFTLEGGRAVSLLGERGVLIVLHNTKAKFTTGIKSSLPLYPSLKEVSLLGNFEGGVHWGLGIGNTGCMRVFSLTLPGRIIIDIGH